MSAKPIQPANEGDSLTRGVLGTDGTEPLGRCGVPRLFLKADVNPLWFCFGRRLLFGSCGHGTFSLSHPQHTFGTRHEGVAERHAAMRHAFGTKVGERKFERAVQELGRNRIEIASSRCARRLFFDLPGNYSIRNLIYHEQTGSASGRVPSVIDRTQAPLLPASSKTRPSRPKMQKAQRRRGPLDCSRHYL